MFSVEFQLITGMMLGLEFPNTEPEEEDEVTFSFAMIIDLFILRIVLLKVNLIE